MVLSIMLSNVISRPDYLKKLTGFQNNGLIKVIMGPRRCGKSFLLKLFQKDLLDRGVEPDHLISVDLDDLLLDSLREPKALHSYVLERIKDKNTYYVFIDEVQLCPKFEQVLASLAKRTNIDLYVTGSNAYLLSGELATFLTGRYTKIEMYPLSFKEFRAAVIDDGLTAQEDFERYLQIGSFPALVRDRNDPEHIAIYYSDLIQSIILKDISWRLKLRDTETLFKLCCFLASNIGSAFSSTNIINVLKTQKVEISRLTLSTYLNALIDSYFIERVPRFDVRGKATLRTEEKYYLSDTGFRHHLITSAIKDYGHLLENIVFLELSRRFKNVRVGKNSQKEIDFVVQTHDGFAYYQVAQTVLDPNTLDRELSAFAGIKDAYPRFLLTMDTLGKGRNFDGVKQLNIVEWLLE